MSNKKFKFICSTIPEQLPSEKENDLNNIEINNESKTGKEYLRTSRLQAVQSTDEEKLKPEESLSKSELSNLHNPKDNNKKFNNFLQRTMKKLTRKTENDKKEYVPITETMSLPSLEGLDMLSTSASVEKKQKTKFINKYVKKVQLKKVLVKS